MTSDARNLAEEIGERLDYARQRPRGLAICCVASLSSGAPSISPGKCAGPAPIEQKRESKGIVLEYRKRPGLGLVVPRVSAVDEKAGKSGGKS